MNDRPTIVCLCGSTRFRDAFESAMRRETLAGRIVLTVGMFGHVEGLDMDGPVKAILDQLHFRKIEMADEVLILNVGNYIGHSTRNELRHAERCGKMIRFLEIPSPDFGELKGVPPLESFPRTRSRDVGGRLMPDIPTAVELRARVPLKMHELQAEVARLARERDRLRAERDRLFEWAWHAEFDLDHEWGDAQMEEPEAIQRAMQTMTISVTPCPQSVAALAAHDAEVNRADA